MKDISRRMMHSPDSDVIGRYKGEKTKQQLENEVKLLREKLAAAQHTLGEMGHQMDLQKTRTRQLLAGWKLKLEESEDKIMSQAHEKDTQFTDLISDLMYFEGCLKRERQEIVSKLGDKDRRIRELERLVMKQEKQINALNKANEKLISSLHDTRGMSLSMWEDDRSYRTKSSDDSHHDESSSSHDNSSESERVSSPSPMMSIRRPNGRRCTVHSGPTSQQLGATRHHNNNNTLKPDSPTNGHQHRVRFVDDVVNDHSSSRPRKGFLMKPEDRSKARKISLPAYRLPVPSEGDENVRFF